MTKKVKVYLLQVLEQRRFILKAAIQGKIGVVASISELPICLDAIRQVKYPDECYDSRRTLPKKGV